MTSRHFRKSMRLRATPGAVFGYVFFLLFPHVAALSHTHGGGAHAHHHAFLSAHDLSLEHAALAVAPEGSPNGELDREEPPRVVPRAKGVATLDVPHGFRHTHVQDDPNVLGLGAPEFAPCEPAIRPEVPSLAVTDAPRAAARAASARAPPRA